MASNLIVEQPAAIMMSDEEPKKIEDSNNSFDESDFSEVKRKKPADDRNKLQAPLVSGSKEPKQIIENNQEDITTKDDKKLEAGTSKITSIKKETNCKKSSSASGKQSGNLKVFGKDFVEAPVPKTNAWVAKKGTRSAPFTELSGEGRPIDSTASAKNTNAAETVAGEAGPRRTRSNQPSESLSNSPCKPGTEASNDTPKKTDAKDYKNAERPRRNSGKTETSLSQRKSRTQSGGESPRSNTQSTSSNADNKTSNKGQGQARTSSPAAKTSNKSRTTGGGGGDRKKDFNKQQNPNLDDSMHWPILHKSPETIEEQPEITSSAKPVKQLCTKRVDEVVTSEHEPQHDSNSESSPERSSNNQSSKGKRKNKQKWIALVVETPRQDRRRRGGSRSRGGGASESRHEEQSGAVRRNERPPFRRPNRDRDTSNDKPGAGRRLKDKDQDNRQQPHEPERGISREPGMSSGRGFRGRRGGQTRGRGYLGNRSYRGSNSFVPNGEAEGCEDELVYAESQATPFFMPPVFYPNQTSDASKFSLHPSPIYYGSVQAQIQRQIEYYFSEMNLEGDFFMRRNMDKDGWLLLSLLKTFRRVMELTSDDALIVESMIKSDKVEVSEDQQKLRAKETPEKWTLCGVNPQSYSDLRADVPEFVPGKSYPVVPATEVIGSSDTKPFVVKDKSDEVENHEEKDARTFSEGEALLSPVQSDRLVANKEITDQNC